MMRTLAQLLVLALAPSLFAQSADLTVNPTVFSPTRVLLGQRVSVSFTVANHGRATANGVLVHVDADPQWQDVQITFPGNCITDCSLGDLVPGAGTTVNVTAIAPVRPAFLHITLSASSSVADPDTSNNSATATIEAFDAPDLQVRLVPVLYGYRPESRGALDAVVYNTGSMTANGVAVIVDLPPGSKAISGTGPDGFVCETDGARIVCRGDTLPVTGFSAARFHIVFVNPPLNDGGTVTATAEIASIERDFNDADNSASTSWKMPQLFAVTSLADSGPGSLRDTIALANAQCQPQCVVGIRIPEPLPPSGFFTIRPESPLPAMNFPGTLDARAQADILGIDFTTPMVMLDGSRQPSGDGIVIMPAAASTVGVAGFAIGNFPRFAIFIDDPGPDVFGNATLESDYLGVDATGHTAAPNLRGVVNSASTASLTLAGCVVSGNTRTGIVSAALLSVNNSRIGVAADSDAPLPNGGSGIYVPGATPTYVQSSVVAWNREFAMALNPQQHDVLVYRNSIHDNGGSVDYGMDGPTPNADDDSHRPPNYPILDDAQYDAATGKTVITLHLTSKPPAPIVPNPDESAYTINADVYANDEAGAQAQRFLGTAVNGTLTADGDLRGQFITAMTRRYRYDRHYDACRSRNETSEISPAIAVR